MSKSTAIQAAVENLQVGEQIVIPLTVEEIEIGKRRTVRGKVRLRKSVKTEKVTIDETGMVERVDIQRVPIQRPVDTAPTVRYEGDTMIIPIVEEVIVIEKRLMLVEEVHVTKQTVRTHHPLEIELRRQELTVERFDSEGLSLTPPESTSVGLDE